MLSFSQVKENVRHKIEVFQRKRAIVRDAREIAEIAAHSGYTYGCAPLIEKVQTSFASLLKEEARRKKGGDAFIAEVKLDAGRGIVAVTLPGSTNEYSLWNAAKAVNDSRRSIK
ncbi:MAG: hypothetical protein WC717_00730 [Candidatus Micrarchaeia archaeon]|jgi:hypothetical protein